MASENNTTGRKKVSASISSHKLPLLRNGNTSKIVEYSQEIVTKIDDQCYEIDPRGRKRIYATAAEKQLAYRHRKKQRSIYPPLPQGPYRIIYADPPWQYENDGLKKYGHAVFHYPTLSIEALCQIPIKSLTEKHAVLFLWVTSPMLFACVPVVQSWGFTYKSSFVWDKDRHNFGHYNGPQHELLLICTRGNCKPDISTLVPSVQVIPRTKHSTKPEEFRVVIDTLYPEGRRLELFARTHTEGWDTWGNDIVIKQEVCDGSS